jgi:hypothetical protein
MIYTQLPTTYKYDTLAEAIYGREIEYFHYEFDKINFEYILKDLPECDYRTNIDQRLFDTLGAMAQVEKTMAALKAQIDDEVAYAASVIRATEKRASDKLKENK